MLNRNGDADRRQRKRNFLDSVLLGDARPRRHDLRDRLERRAFEDDGRRNHFHLVRRINVMCGVGFREVLAVFRERRQSCDREQQQDDCCDLKAGSG